MLSDQSRRERDTKWNAQRLVAARFGLLRRLEYNVKQRGLTGAPRLRIVMSEEAHPTNITALGYLGFGLDDIEYCLTGGTVLFDKNFLESAVTLVMGRSLYVSDAG